MLRLGLALSGGGLRATLFHLGVVRFLRDAGLLGDVTHLVSVSGGSILGAHLALNWERYNEVLMVRLDEPKQ
jgi:predicted acylesterase/phospholipase RssA